MISEAVKSAALSGSAGVIEIGGAARSPYGGGVQSCMTEVSTRGIPTSAQAMEVLDILREAQELFLHKNRGYGNTAEYLGAKGQFSDIYRKVGKLKHTLWDGNEPVGESIEEMCMDLIGHCALTIHFLRGSDV